MGNGDASANKKWCAFRGSYKPPLKAFPSKTAPFWQVECRYVDIRAGKWHSRRFRYCHKCSFRKFCDSSASAGKGFFILFVLFFVGNRLEVVTYPSQKVLFWFSEAILTYQPLLKVLVCSDLLEEGFRGKVNILEEVI